MTTTVVSRAAAGRRAAPAGRAEAAAPVGAPAKVVPRAPRDRAVAPDRPVEALGPRAARDRAVLPDRRRARAERLVLAARECWKTRIRSVIRRRACSTTRRTTPASRRRAKKK